MSKKAQQLAARFGRTPDLVEAAKDVLEEQYRQSAYANPDCAIITSSKAIQVFKWGLIPYWTKTAEDAAKIRKMTINARSETAFELPSFKGPILSKRCIVPSTGYFEWRHEPDGSKTPYFIYVKDEDIFSMAGVYDAWLDKQTGQLLHTFTILTTRSNELTGYIHNNPQSGNRMPVILRPEDEERWLNPALNKQEIADFFKPFDEQRMDAYTLKNDFLKKAPSDRTILERR